mmetsp:Transcript_83880/g.218492  ORF Transcript_83880/g.218492 Transcript_83880/m.218492 type:complete len:212 (+) Transcript_83880:568-1203(+)
MGLPSAPACAQSWISQPMATPKIWGANGTQATSTSAASRAPLRMGGPQQAAPPVGRAARALSDPSEPPASEGATVMSRTSHQFGRSKRCSRPSHEAEKATPSLLKSTLATGARRPKDDSSAQCPAAASATSCGAAVASPRLTPSKVGGGQTEPWRARHSASSRFCSSSFAAILPLSNIAISSGSDGEENMTRRCTGRTSSRKCQSLSSNPP